MLPPKKSVGDETFITLAVLSEENMGEGAEQTGLVANPEQSWPVVPGYTILQVLGRGSMKTTFRAVHEQDKREVALKVVDVRGVSRQERVVRALDKRYLTTSSEEREYKIVEILRKEARFLRQASLNRCQRLPVYIWDNNYDKETGLFVIAEELGGKTLESILESQGPLVASRVSHFMGEYLSGLQEVHSLTAELEDGAKLFYMDATPQNLLLNQDETIRIIDLGHSSLFDSQDLERFPQQYIGCTVTLAPELLDGRRETEKSEVWSAGVLAYKMLTGEWPIPWPGNVTDKEIQQLGMGERETVRMKYVAVLREKYSSKRARRIALRRNTQYRKAPRRLQKIIEDCLHYDPERRPSIVQLQKRLRSTRSMRRKLLALGVVAAGMLGLGVEVASYVDTATEYDLTKRTITVLRGHYGYGEITPLNAIDHCRFIGDASDRAHVPMRFRGTLLRWVMGRQIEGRARNAILLAKGEVLALHQSDFMDGVWEGNVGNAGLTSIEAGLQNAANLYTAINIPASQYRDAVQDVRDAVSQEYSTLTSEEIDQMIRSEYLPPERLKELLPFQNKNFRFAGEFGLRNDFCMLPDSTRLKIVSEEWSGQGMLMECHELFGRKENGALIELESDATTRTTFEYDGQRIRRKKTTVITPRDTILPERTIVTIYNERGQTLTKTEDGRPLKECTYYDNGHRRTITLYQYVDGDAGPDLVTRQNYDENGYMTTRELLKPLIPLEELAK